MGSSTSKAAKAAASTASRRQYPTRPPPTSSPATQPSPSAAESQAAVTGASVHPPPHASETKDSTITNDARDPDFNSSLRSLGPVQPNSTMSNTSTFRPSSPVPNNPSFSDPSPPAGGNLFPSIAQNPALEILQARDKIAAEAEMEFAAARRGKNSGRQFLDIGTIRQVLVMRDQKGMQVEEVERTMGLGKGIVQRLAAVREGRVGRKEAGDSGLYG